MQIFLPYPDLAESARCLDPKRLGNQVYRECTTLIRGRWPNHPVSRMWRDFPHALAVYALAGLDELQRRGRNYPNWKAYFSQFVKGHPLILPPWLGDDRLHASHRSNLLRKDYDWYSRYGWDEPDDLPYYWPV